MKLNKPTRLLIVLVAVFITCAVTAELISSKLFQIDLGAAGTYISIVGIFPWPVVFLTTDIINEFYGRKIVRMVSVITAAMIGLCFMIVYISMQPQAFVVPGTVDDSQFNAVFGQSMWMIAG